MASILMRPDSKLDRPLRILVIAPEPIKPEQQGGDLRLYWLLAFLAKSHHVTLCTIFDRAGEESDPDYRESCRQIGLRYIRFTGHDALKSELVRRVYDVVIFEFWLPAQFLAGFIRGFQPWIRIVVDSVDVAFRREEASLAFGISDPAKVELDKQQEISTYRAADAVVCVSGEDARLLETQGGMPRMFVIPLLVPERPRSSMARGPEMVFLGGFRHTPNSDGLRWFASEIWPIIRGNSPVARLTVIGSNPTPEILELSKIDGIDVIGFVPDVGPYLDRAGFMVAPLRFGSGVKTKVVEAMASGLAVLTTSVGSQGLDVVPGEQIMIADEPGEFALAACDLLEDPERAERIGSAARAYVSDTYSYQTVGSAMEAMLVEVIGQGRVTVPPGPWVIKSLVDRTRRTVQRMPLLKRLIQGAIRPFRRPADSPSADPGPRPCRGEKVSS